MCIYDSYHIAALTLPPETIKTSNSNRGQHKETKHIHQQKKDNKQHRNTITPNLNSNCNHKQALILVLLKKPQF
jgi:hypothetical protein